MEDVTLDTVYLDAAAQEKGDHAIASKTLQATISMSLNCACICHQVVPILSTFVKAPWLSVYQMCQESTTSGDGDVHLYSIVLFFVAAVAELLRGRGVPHVLFWPEDPTGLVAAQFSYVFFSTLAAAGSSIMEAYAQALYATQAHCGLKSDGKLMMPGMPDLLAGTSGPEGDGVELLLPDNTTIPPPEVPGLELSKGIVNAVAGEGGVAHWA